MSRIGRIRKEHTKQVVRLHGIYWLQTDCKKQKIQSKALFQIAPAGEEIGTSALFPVSFPLAQKGYLRKIHFEPAVMPGCPAASWFGIDMPKKY
jgi:hypothetical protein